MQPDLPTPHQNPYDFIMNSGQPQKPAKMPGMPSSGNGQMQRLIFVGAGAVILVIIGIIVFNILSSSGKGTVTQLKSLAAEQAEIIRIADLGLTSAKSTNARNLAATTTITVRTMQQRTTKLLSLKGQEVAPKELGIFRNEDTEAALKAAEQSNRYDEAFLEYMISSLNKYQSSIKAAYDANTGTNDREVLEAAFTSTALILENQLGSAN